MSLLVVIPKESISGLYFDIRRLIQTKPEWKGKDYILNDTAYFELLEYAFNAFLRLDYPDDFEYRSNELIECILFSYDLLSLDTRVEELLLLFPTNTKRIDFVGADTASAIWRVTF